MADDPEPPSWHAAVASATFVPYHASGATRSWAGGFGGTPGSPPSHLQVNSLVDGVQVWVDTIDPHDGETAEMMLTNAVTDQLFHHVLGRPSLSLPLDITVVADDRVVIVDGVPRTCRGVRVDGTERWIGYCDLHRTWIRVATERPVEVVLEPLGDASSIPPSRPDGDPMATPDDVAR